MYFSVRAPGIIIRAPYRSPQPKWRNWQTRQVQDLVPVKGVEVRVLSSAVSRGPVTIKWDYHELGLATAGLRAHFDRGDRHYSLPALLALAGEALGQRS